MKTDNLFITILDNLVITALFIFSAIYISVENTVWQPWLILTTSTLILGYRINKKG